MKTIIICLLAIIGLIVLTAIWTIRRKRNKIIKIMIDMKGEYKLEQVHAAQAYWFAYSKTYKFTEGFLWIILLIILVIGVLYA